jgi:hypothetical protein
MVLTLSFGISDITLADTGNLAVPTAAYLVRPAACLAAVNGYGFTLGPFRSNRAKHDFKQRSRVSAAPSRLQRRGLGRGDSR